MLLNMTINFNRNRMYVLEKPLFEICCFYNGIAQIALDPPLPPLSKGQMWKKGPQTILASPYTPGQALGKKCPKPSWEAFTPTPAHEQCPY